MKTRGKPRRTGAKGSEGQRAAAGRQGPEADRNAETFAQTPERIAKLMARAGVASRREAERMIVEGRVRLNGKPLESPAINVTMSDRIEIDGEPMRGIERTRLWLYHKPAGLVTTHKDPENRPTVFDNLPIDQPHVVSVGRLDINTEGLLLLTNDGGLARELELPSTGWLRRYRVRAHGKIDQAGLDRLQDGIAVDGVLYGAIDATLDRTQGSNVWLTMGFREGKNREIKNVLGALGLEVNRLIRISYGPFQLAALKEGAVQEVRSRTLREQLGPRLIEKSGANFEAPLFNDPSAEEKKKPAAKKAAKTEKPPASGRKLSREEKRDRDLGRLDTSKPEKAPAKKRPVNRNRSSNVWMAPGARPLSPKKGAQKPASKRAGGKGGARPAGKSGSGRSGNADRRR